MNGETTFTNFQLIHKTLRKMVHFVHVAMQNIVFVGFMSFLLIVVPMLGIMAVHERK